MVLRDLLLASLTGCHLHVAHVSTKGSVRAIRDAKSRGVRVTCEAAPHHFSLTDAALSAYDTNLKMNPPLRTQEDVEAVIQGLADGTIDCIASDHAPHSVLEKDVEFTSAAFGILGLETSVGLSLEKLVKTGQLALPRLVERMSVAPAKILRLAGKGSLAPGSDADVTVLDPTAAWTVDVQKFQSVSKNSPFHGWNLTGRAVLTVASGRVVHRDGV
jgi:dihydroorotase